MAALAVAERDDRVTVFVMVPFWRDRRGLVPGERKQFEAVDQAVSAAQKAAAHQAGVIVCSVSGNLDADYWEEPIPVWASGEIPDYES